MQLQGTKVLLLGDARAFFTMYKSIVDAGLKPFQLDRDKRLTAAGGTSEQLRAAAEQAASAADCILVAPQQSVSPGFPFARSVHNSKHALYHCLHNTTTAELYGHTLRGSHGHLNMCDCGCEL